MLVVGLSLFAALCFAVAVVLQQYAASEQPAEYNLKPGLIVRLAQRPIWLLGIVASGVGSLVQLIALWHGTLVTVQPLLVCGLLFALVINAVAVQHRRPEARELLSAAVVCGGLALFLVATDPRRGSGHASGREWAVTLAVVGGIVALCVGGSLVSRGARRAGLLALAAGVINGLSAAFTKGIARDLGHDWGAGAVHAVLHEFGDWELYAFVGTLLAALLLVQSAFQDGPIRWSLPVLTASNPVTSVLIGVSILGEDLRSGAFAIVGSVAGLGLVVAGVLALSSSTLVTGERSIAIEVDPAPPPAEATGEPRPEAASGVAPAGPQGLAERFG